MESYQNLAKAVLETIHLDDAVFQLNMVTMRGWKNGDIEVLHSIEFEDPKKQFIYNIHGGDAVFVHRIQQAYENVKLWDNMMKYISEDKELMEAMQESWVKDDE